MLSGVCGMHLLRALRNPQTHTHNHKDLTTPHRKILMTSTPHPSSNQPLAEMDVADSLLDVIGNTPLVRLDRMRQGLKPTILAKVEYLNPGGSVKDRPAVSMIDEAEKQRLLKPGGTIVEATSGNTGVGLALVAARRGYGCVFVVPDKVASEKIDLLRAYGAQVVVCPTSVAPDDPESYYSVSARLAQEIPGAFQPNQYDNPANPLAHVQTTGPELWAQTKGRITHFVAGMGTGGTISGTARYLKSQNPNIQVIGADPVGSVYSGGTGRPYLVEGVGEDLFPQNYDVSVIDRVIAVQDAESFRTARALAKQEGILAGGSSGMAVFAALRVAENLSSSEVIVVVLPDSGRGYLTKLYNDDWMARYGFLGEGTETVADMLGQKSLDVPSIIHVRSDQTIREAIEVMHWHEVSQLLVASADPPLVLGEVRGSVSERQLLRLAMDGGASLDEPVGGHLAPRLPEVGVGESPSMVLAHLEESSAVVVVDRGYPVGVLTSTDLLQFVAHGRSRVDSSVHTRKDT